MEIKYEVTEKLNFSLDNTKITGIATTNKDETIEVLSLENSDKVELYINNIKQTAEEKEKIKREISVISELNKLPFLRTIEDYMNYIIKKDLLNIKNPSKKKEDSLRIVGLETTYLNRELITLSSSEKFLVQVAIALLSNPNILIFVNSFTYIDLQQEKRLMQLLLRLKEQFHKTIVIIDDNCDKLYRHTNKMIFIKNNEVILEAPTTEAYTRVDFLSKHRFSVPSIIKLTYLARKNKGTKIIYHKDIRDLIKDIYKHV